VSEDEIQWAYNGRRFLKISLQVLSPCRTICIQSACKPLISRRYSWKKIFASKYEVNFGLEWQSLFWELSTPRVLIGPSVCGMVNSCGVKLNVREMVSCRTVVGCWWMTWVTTIWGWTPQTDEWQSQRFHKEIRKQIICIATCVYVVLCSGVNMLRWMW